MKTLATGLLVLLSVLGAESSIAQQSINAPPDTIFYKSILDLYAVDHDPTWYALAYANAEEAKDNARDETGWWAKDWWGDWADPGVLFTPAATLEMFAWMAATPPPGS